ncbi:hypothetical protein [Pontibacter litorisediminis]|uniref:hypothetical protein n=1 Tax=Pontibacter litorisediminis TaxID=1846260 RepID=UPI0023EB270C|nr:hypothetical protein [Pontibacter litorisediminis]
MKNIATVPGQSGGIFSRFYFTESRSLPELLPTDGTSITGDLQLTPGTLFNFIDATQFTPDFDQQDDDDVNGISYSHNFSGFVAGDTPELAAALLSMKGRHFVLLYRDFDEQLKLIGDREHHLVFDYRLSSGNNPGDRKGYKFSFKGKSRNPSFFYNGSFEVAEVGIIAPPVTTDGTPVRMEDTHGNLIANIPAGKTLVIRSGFKLIYTII